MTVKELREIKAAKLKGCYTCVYWNRYEYNNLSNIMYIKRAGKGNNASYNDCIIMADTETSKKTHDRVFDNHVCAWTISIRAYHENIVTLYGTKPSDMVTCFRRIKRHMAGDKTIIYWHNLSYDYVFMRRFVMQKFGKPVKQLATKPHYPIYIEYENGIIFKDSLILAQRGLEKWADDLQVEHQKAVGKWDYDKIRHQKDCNFSAEELEYIEHDTLAGVECIDKTMIQLRKRIYSMPYTATGIPREEARKRGKQYGAREDFLRIVPKNYDTQLKLENVYHGGFVHANRHYINVIMEDVDGLDFTSSYPYCMLAFKYPCSEFKPFRNCSVKEILDSADDYAFIFKLILVNVKLKSDEISMPALQYSKCVKDVNACCDNGRILCANYVEIYLNEIDLSVIEQQYTWTGAACVEVEYSDKAYLPRWYTDYVFECFTAKTMLKKDKKHPELYDPVAYSLAKAKVNSLYGMFVQKPCKEDIEENYATGEYTVKSGNDEELYQKYINNKNSILLYQWGVWVTSYAFRNLFLLGQCCGLWLYSDTDSCYGKYWDMDKVSEYNENCKKLLRANNYGAVVRDGVENWLGVVDIEHHDKFKAQGAKRYAVIDDTKEIDDVITASKLKITVAGVPKKTGAKCLRNLDDFDEGFIFSGKFTGKQTHTYMFVDDIYIDENGNETGDSIDLSPCDYLLSKVDKFDWEALFEEDVEIQVYE